MQRFINQYEFRVFAMKRSGHHAVMDWIRRHFSGPVYLLNNCSYSHETMFSSTRYGHLLEETHFGGRVSLFFDRYKLIREEEHLAKDQLVNEPRKRLSTLESSEHRILSENGLAGERDAFLFNLEDFPVDRIREVPLEAARRGESRQIVNVIVLRDPFNWLASRYKGQFPIDEKIISAWCGHCREALRETEHLANLLVVNYNLWFSDSQYRQGLTEKLGLDMTEPGIGELTNFGGGSSFSGMEHRLEAAHMDVLHRWKLLQDVSEYRELFAGRDELTDLARRLFSEVAVPDFIVNK